MNTGCIVRKCQIIAFVAVFLLLATIAHPAVYLLDDGSPDTWGGTRSGDLLSINHFDTAGETVTIDGIWVTWNPLSSAVYPAVALYSDPNGDGNPFDMTLLAAQSIFLQGGIVYLNQSYQYYPITPTTVTGSFFAGAFLSDADFSNDPRVGVDTSSPTLYGQSWIIENSLGAGRMSLSNPIGTSTLRTPLDTYISGNFLIRAEYHPVPEPSIGSLWIVGVSVAMRCRRISRTRSVQKA